MTKTMTEVSFNWQDIELAVQDIAMKMYADEWRPDYIVAITRGGLVPGVMLSQMTGIPLNTLSVQLGSEDFPENVESNCWMSEDAFGYNHHDELPFDRKNILIIDDINRGGDAMAWIIDDWKQSCFPDDPRWNDIFHNTVRFASLVDNPDSLVSMNYSYTLDDDTDVWFTFPWER